MHRIALGVYILPFFLIIISNCIERDNPFDPLNFSPDRGVKNPAVGEIRDSTLSHFDSVKIEYAPNIAQIESTFLLLSTDFTALDSLRRVNDSIRRYNDTIRNQNTYTQRYNDTVFFPDSLRLKSSLDTLFHLCIKSDTIPLQGFLERTQLTRARFASTIDSINAAFAPDTVFSPGLRDSVLLFFDSLIIRTSDGIDKIDSLRVMVMTENDQQIHPYNQLIITENAEIFDYNEDIGYKKKFQRYDPITNVDSLRREFSLAGPGDIFVIAGGSFTPFLQTDSSGTDKEPIIIQGQPDMSTIFIRPEIILSDNRHFIFRNIVFRESGLDGIRLENESGPIVFDKCHFEQNAGNGLNIIDSDVRIINCRITGNVGCGIFASSDQQNDNYVHIHNSLIAQNHLSGIEIIAATNLYVTNTTISDNGGQGLFLRGPEITLQINNSILSFNKDGIVYDSPFSSEHLFTLGATVIFGNLDRSIRVVIDQIPEYIDDIDPLFMDKGNLDYRISSQSELKTLEELGISIGYRP